MMLDLSRVQPVPLSQLLNRGIYRLPVIGAHGETILIAVDDQHHMTASSPYTIKDGEDPAESVEWLTAELRNSKPRLRLT